MAVGSRRDASRSSTLSGPRHAWFSYLPLSKGSAASERAPARRWALAGGWTSTRELASDEVYGKGWRGSNSRDEGQSLA